MTNKDVMMQDVSSLNEAFGNSAGTMTNPNWFALSNQAKNIKDEYDELMEAIENSDMIEVRDAICDILVFTLGLAHMSGAPVTDDMKEVDASNRSKFCHDQENVDATVKKYTDLGVMVYVDGEFPVKRVKSSIEQVGFDGKTYRANKMLKSVSFKEPVFA